MMDKEVSKFYHKIQFPGHYTQKEIMKKSEDFLLADWIPLRYLPFKGKILEVGCGSGYTTHVIATLRRDIEITGIDFSKCSLEFAENFTKQNNYHNTKFQLADLREINLPENYYDMIICSGVLHHIENPRPIFTNLCKLVKKDGVIIVGLYHPWGRFSVHSRQKFFKITGGRMRWVDPRIRNENWTEQRKETWYRDQYEHPHEDDYSHKTLLQWFKEEGISYIGSLPKYDGNNISYDFYMLTRMGYKGGLFIFIGRKNGKFKTDDSQKSFNKIKNLR